MLTLMCYTLKGIAKSNYMDSWECDTSHHMVFQCWMRVSVFPIFPNIVIIFVHLKVFSNLLFMKKNIFFYISSVVSEIKYFHMSIGHFYFFCELSGNGKFENRHNSGLLGLIELNSVKWQAAYSGNKTHKWPFLKNIRKLVLFLITSLFAFFPSFQWITWMQYAYLCQGVFFVVLLSMNIMYIPW